MAEKDPRPVLDVSSKDNLTELKAKIHAAYENVQSMRTQRGALNDEIAAEMATIEAKGIPKSAFRMAMKYHEMDEDERRGFDVAYRVVREALGDPIQKDMFEGKPS